ncbi:MAG: hypothetical protein ACFE0P_00175 [Oceanicaulis sp.]
MIPLPTHAAPALATPASPKAANSGETRTVSSVLRRHLRRRKLRWYR